MCDVSKCNDLDELFRCWRKAHCDESEEEYKKYGDQFVSKVSFTIDGFIDEQAYRSQEKRILLIAKESNEFGKRPNEIQTQKCATGIHFWLSKMVKDGKTNRFINGLAILCNGLISPESEEPCIDTNVLNNAAFMNINKRAGFSRSNPITISGYFCNYKEYIRREIQLIDPTYIICCGKGIKSLVEKVFDKQDNIFESIHPSMRFLSRKKLLKDFLTSNGLKTE